MIWEKEKCPVCGRAIGVCPSSAVIRPHTDKVGRRCPMSGKAVA